MSGYELHLCAEQAMLLSIAVEEARDVCRHAANTSRLPLSARNEARRRARQFQLLLDFLPGPHAG